MLPSGFRVWLILLALLGAGLTAGCAGKSVAGTRFYVLTPLAAEPLANAGRAQPLSVDVVDLRLPQYLERPQIVTRTGDNRLALAEFHQWGGNLRKDMHRTLARNLSVLLATPNVSISPNRPPKAADFRVELEVMQFEQGADARVRLSVQWRLSQGRDRVPLEVRILDLESPEVIGEPDFDAIVSAMSALYGELSRDVARAILARASP
jgi:uncharacterized protein